MANAVINNTFYNRKIAFNTKNIPIHKTAARNILK
jgi:hypothetical protein